MSLNVENVNSMDLILTMGSQVSRSDNRTPSISTHISRSEGCAPVTPLASRKSTCGHSPHSKIQLTRAAVLLSGNLLMIFPLCFTSVSIRNPFSSWNYYHHFFLYKRPPPLHFLHDRVQFVQYTETEIGTENLCASLGITTHTVTFESTLNLFSHCTMKITVLSCPAVFVS